MAAPRQSKAADIADEFGHSALDLRNLGHFQDRLDGGGGKRGGKRGDELVTREEGYFKTKSG